MHLLRTTPGGFVDDNAGVVRIDQTPADIVVLSSADTTLSLLAAACTRLKAGEGEAAGNHSTLSTLPTLRLASLAFLRQPASIDFYEEDVLQHARVVVVDHLGGEAYWPYGMERVMAVAERQNQALVLFSGDLQEDLALTAKSTVDALLCRQLWRYLREGGPRNGEAFLQVLACLVRPQATLSAAGLLKAGNISHIPAPMPLPAVSIYHPRHDMGSVALWRKDWEAQAQRSNGPDESAAVPEAAQPGPLVLMLFYKAHLQSGNTAVFDALADALTTLGMRPLPIAVTSLKDAESVAAIKTLCTQHDVALVLNTTAFAAASIGRDAVLPGESTGASDGGGTYPSLAGDAPVLQLILSSANREDWLADEQGLRARDVAMHIALPEVDGRIITRAISFKGMAYHCPLTQIDVVRYEADAERVRFVAELSARWCRLRSQPNSAKRVALILANYPLAEGRIGNGVGLDTPASAAGILHEMARQGYALGIDESEMPDGAALMAHLTEGVTNQPSSYQLRPAFQSLPMARYRAFFDTLPETMRDPLLARWGQPEDDPTVRDGRFMIAGRRLGHVFVGIQPPRTRDSGDYASYHDGELVPPHAYLAFYLWLRESFRIDAVVHVGKHGNLEWLPGKSVALGANCWPDRILGPLPHLYPFIVNDPGEGSQAKRRAQAVIIDHLMPPLTRAETYGPLQDLERQVDEYYEALMVDPRRAKLLRRDILKTIVVNRVHEELGLQLPGDELAEDALLNKADAYLCELKEAQIRDGLHVFGSSPAGVQRRDTLLALSRYPIGDGEGGNSGLIAALARDFQLSGEAGGDFDPLNAEPARPWTGRRPALLLAVSDAPWRHHGDTRERLELFAQGLLDRHADAGPTGTRKMAELPQMSEMAQTTEMAQMAEIADMPATAQVMARITHSLAPRLDACGPQEMHQLLRGLAGRFVPPGPSGAPSRGRPDVLPTGRNFYSVDTRAIPTRSAWELGLRSANQLVERHVQDHGDFPRAIGLSVWGTATMRTGGDDIAQAFALIGVRPKWAAGSHRVSDFEILPITIFNRPRIDVTLRVSGFFRDAFANVMHLFDAAVQAVADLDEPEAENPIRARVIRERDALIARGVDAELAREQAGWRVFSSRPGTYGAGLQSMMDNRGWQDDADLSLAYRDWGGYVYSSRRAGLQATDTFGERLASLDVVLQNQDNREHDVLDSNDYYQFQGGMTAAVRHLSGAQPTTYLADHQLPSAPRIRTLGEEVARVVRSRVVNPKWIDGVKRHGYKGAAELADTVDCLFGYDATARVVKDHQYELVTQAYILDADTRAFLERHNPQALAAICERMLEAMQRGLWEAPGPYRAEIEKHLLASEALLEQNT